MAQPLNHEPTYLAHEYPFDLFALPLLLTDLDASQHGLLAQHLMAQQ